MANILIVEDEKAINDLLLMNLRLVGHSCMQIYDGRQAENALGFRPDLILLDVMLPYADGFQLLRENVFREIPVIFVTARSNTADKVEGLKLGADDYITKPFDTVELLARVEAVLRRTKKSENVVCVGDAAVHLEEHTVTLRGERVELTNREFTLLTVLCQNRNLALSREKLLDLVWGYDYYGDTRTVDVHITKLRKKLQLDKEIKTVYKLGYRLELPRE